MIGGRGDLSTLIAGNQATNVSGFVPSIWRLTQDGQRQVLFKPVPPQELSLAPGGTYVGTSADGGRVVAWLEGGSLDPAHPAATAAPNLYDISEGGTPQLLSLLPGGVIASCGTQEPSGDFASPPQSSSWVSADGSLVYFSSSAADCDSQPQLYLRDIGAATTRSISSAPVSGPTCGATLVKALPGAAFLWSESRLAADDTVPAACGHQPGSDPDGDVYRYDLATEALDCLTCIATGFDANVIGDGSSKIAVAEDGSRVYFTTQARLLAAAPPSGEPGTYRIDVSSGELAYVGPLASDIGTTAGQVAYTRDGSQFFFRSSSAALNPLGGISTNGGKAQFYRYDDRDRSLVCVSCPQDGSTSATGVEADDLGKVAAGQGMFAFSTTAPLVNADQNTATGAGQNPASGTDAYEWRDGRLLLITDGLTNWSPQFPPRVQAVSASGRDVFFIASAPLTPDALDDYLRVYDARIGGGFEYPKPPPPCPLEVCQGTPKGAPEEQEPGSGNFSGSGNPTPPAAKPKARRCVKGQRKVRRNGKARCVKRHGKRNANANRRAAR